MTNASLTSDLLDFMRAEEEDETVKEEIPASSSFQMSMKKRIATMAAAKEILENMGFNDMSMLSSIIRAQMLLRQQNVAETATQTKMTEFLT